MAVKDIARKTRRPVKRRKPIPMHEWEVCVRFGLWLARTKNYSDIEIVAPKNPKGSLEKAIKLLRREKWRPDKSGSHFRKRSTTIQVIRSDGKGDVIAKGKGTTLVAECKGWNKKNDSGTRSVFNECIGQALTTLNEEAEPWVVFAETDWFVCQCKKAATLKRVKSVNLQFAVVNRSGNITTF